MCVCTYTLIYIHTTLCFFHFFLFFWCFNIWALPGPGGIARDCWLKTANHGSIVFKCKPTESSYLQSTPPSPWPNCPRTRHQTTRNSPEPHNLLKWFKLASPKPTCPALPVLSFTNYHEAGGSLSSLAQSASWPWPGVACFILLGSVSHTRPYQRQSASDLWLHQSWVILKSTFYNTRLQICWMTQGMPESSVSSRNMIDNHHQELWCPWTPNKITVPF